MNLKSCSILSDNALTTENIAERIGKKLRGREVVELASDLGGGKTTFVRGLTRGLGSKDHVSSPTFKLSNIYKTNRLELHHYDFYRLGEAGIVADELAEALGQPNIVVAVEWGAVVAGILPEERMAVTLTNTGDETRRLTISFPEKLSYLVSDIC